MRKRQLALLPLFILLLCVLTRPARAADEADIAENINESCTFEYGSNPLTRELLDGSGYTRLKLKEEPIVIRTEEEIGGLYIEFSRPPEPWTLQVDGTARSAGRSGYLHEYIGDLGAHELVLRFAPDTQICDIYVLSPGQLPGWVQDWQEPWDRADVLFLPTHSDDDQLYFAGLIPWCLSQGARVQVAFFIQHYDHADRMNELLDGLWTCGLRNYPVLGAFADMGNISYQETIGHYNYYAIYWSDFEGRQAELYRRFQPQVVVTHARNGEYGHGAHILNYMSAVAAAELSFDATAYPETAELYGTWDVPKLYVHNWRDNRVYLDFDQPIPEFDGKTAFQLGQEGFHCHKSQFVWGIYDAWLYRSDKAADINDPSPREYGLYRTTVGSDIHTDTLFDNIVLYDEQERLAAEQAKAEEEAAEAARKAVEEEARLAAARAEEEARLAAEEAERQAAEAERQRSAERTQVLWAIGGVCAVIAGALAAAYWLHRKKDD